MATKSKVKSKPAVKAKSVKAKAVTKKGTGKAKMTGTKAVAKKENVAVKTARKEKSARSAANPRPLEVTRSINLSTQIRRPAAVSLEKRRSDLAAGNQFNFMKAPRPDYAFEVGDNVEVFCDHEKGRERVRGWIKGIVVQVDNKMVAVQFRSNVFLTDGWMVPDRILWYPLNSEHIRPVTSGKKPVYKKDLIPDY